MKQKRVAITGGICSGKSTVCKILENIGYNVFYSDNIAIELANNNIELKNDIINSFGIESYSNGIYNRKYIASIVFNDKDKLSLLNNIFSKHINSAWGLYCNKHKNDNIIFYESALIFEHKKENNFDDIILVFANKDIIFDRMKKRNGFSDEEIIKRYNSQMNPIDKIPLANYVINTNNGINKEIIMKLLEKIQ